MLILGGCNHRSSPMSGTLYVSIKYVLTIRRKESISREGPELIFHLECISWPSSWLNIHLSSQRTLQPVADSWDSLQTGSPDISRQNDGGSQIHKINSIYRKHNRNMCSVNLGNL